MGDKEREEDTGDSKRRKLTNEDEEEKEAVDEVCYPTQNTKSSLHDIIEYLSSIIHDIEYWGKQFKKEKWMKTQHAKNKGWLYIKAILGCVYLYDMPADNVKSNIHQVWTSFWFALLSEVWHQSSALESFPLSILLSRYLSPSQYHFILSKLSKVDESQQQVPHVSNCYSC